MRFRVLMTLVGLFLSGSLAAASIIPRTATKGIYQALYDFTSQDTGEVDLQKGEIVTVLLENASGTSTCYTECHPFSLHAWHR